MKRILIVTVVICLIGFGLAVAQDDIAKHPKCLSCGMDRAKFAHSRVYTEYNDGSTIGTCSVRCAAAVDVSLFKAKSPVVTRVGDYQTKQLIDAEKAVWVIGGDKKGVMTKRAKWAFEKKEDARQFIDTHGGIVTTYDMAMKAAYADMYEDMKIKRENRKKKWLNKSKK